MRAANVRIEATMATTTTMSAKAMVRPRYQPKRLSASSIGLPPSQPRAGARLRSTGPSVGLVVSGKPVAQNSGGSLLGRVITLDGPVGPAQLADAKKVTDEIVTKGENVELKAQPAAVTQDGLPGYFY